MRQHPELPDGYNRADPGVAQQDHRGLLPGCQVEERELKLAPRYRPEGPGADRLERWGYQFDL